MSITKNFGVKAEISRDTGTESAYHKGKQEKCFFCNLGKHLMKVSMCQFKKITEKKSVCSAPQWALKKNK